jgi:hypothetical protein
LSKQKRKKRGAGEEKMRATCDVLQPRTALVTGSSPVWAIVTAVTARYPPVRNYTSLDAEVRSADYSGLGA